MRKKRLDRKRRKARRSRHELEKARIKSPALDEPGRTEAKTIAPTDGILGG